MNKKNNQVCKEFFAKQLLCLAYDVCYNNIIMSLLFLCGTRYFNKTTFVVFIIVS